MRRNAAVVAVLMLSVPRLARPDPDAMMRAEIQKRVRTFVEAANRGDVSALMEMYSHKPEVASVGYGGIARGWDAIRIDNEQLVGKEGSFTISIGLIDVVPLGTTYALAFTSGMITAASETVRRVRLAQVPVAFTFLFERSRDGWMIVHQHASAKQ